MKQPRFSISSATISVSIRAVLLPEIVSAIESCRNSFEVIKSKRVSLSVVYAAVVLSALLYLTVEVF